MNFSAFNCKLQLNYRVFVASAALTFIEIFVLGTTIGLQLRAWSSGPIQNPENLNRRLNLTPRTKKSERKKENNHE